MASDFHDLLFSQIEKYFGGIENIPHQWVDFILGVNASYHAFDREHHMIEQSLSVQSEDLLRKSSTLKAIFKALPDILLRIDRDGNILDYKSDATTSHYFLPRSMVGKNIRDLPDPEMFSKFKRALEAIDENEQSLVNLEHTLRLKQTELHFEVRMQPFLDREVIVIIRNVTERMNAIKKLKESERRYALAAMGSNDGLWDWDLTADQVFFSARWKAILGYGDSEIENKISSWFNHVHADDVAKFSKAIAAAKQGVKSVVEIEYRLLHRNGNYRWVLTRGTAVKNAQGKVIRMAGSQTDITHRKQSEDQLRYDALHDKLTGLPNRTLFMDRLTHLCHRAQRYQEYRFAVMFIDVDKFKSINDTYGHDVGDEVLKRVSDILQEAVRGVDTVARLAGDEFTILLENVLEEKTAVMLAERIQELFAKPFKINDKDIQISISLGINMSSPEKNDPHTLLKDADTAMYSAKKGGRARFEVFSQNS